jgi:phenylalanine-4-hydroxylase
MKSLHELTRIAANHGVDIKQVDPPSLEARLDELKKCLLRSDVPYPIPTELAQATLQSASRGIPFTQGSLSGQSVELGEYGNAQHYDQYSLEEHLSWACLIADQQRTKKRYACREYLSGESMFSIGGTTIPDFYRLNARIFQQTGWQLATVSMIIPAELFFTCHSRRFFPVTTFMRRLEQDYLQEPDIGHDVAGHVATFTIPVVARVMENHGLARNLIYQQRDQRLSTVSDPDEQTRVRKRADELLLYAERIYWFTVEFGLVMQEDSLRAYGAGILSSPGETQYSIDSPKPTRILIDPSQDSDLLRLASTDYLISEFQKTYFVTKQFELLESITAERIIRIAETASRLPHFSWRDVAPGDQVLNFGESSVSTNEKYLRLMCDQPADECLTRTAIRNLRLFNQGMDAADELDRMWRAPLPRIPENLLQWFRDCEASGKFDDQLIRPLSIDGRSGDSATK